MKKLLFWLITIIFALLLLEGLASLLLLYGYRSSETGTEEFDREISSFSTVNALHRMGRQVGLFNDSELSTVRYNRISEPDPFYVPDDLLGFRADPGVYRHIYLRQDAPHKKWKSMETRVTINPDGTRWTGNVNNPTSGRIFFFGDSYVFGSGVSDEQTFPYLLQQAMPNREVKLYALGGYSLTHAYLNFERIRDTIRPQDTIVIGYSSFLDVRNVIAPSRLREVREWWDLYSPEAQDRRNRLLPGASVDNRGNVQVNYIQENCLENDGYCDQKDPHPMDMKLVTAALINHIATSTEARVYLLHLYGRTRPMGKLLELVDDSVTLISALGGDFEHFVWDDIEGFDPHPGPYWHYSISRKLIESLPAE